MRAGYIVLRDVKAFLVVIFSLTSCVYHPIVVFERGESASKKSASEEQRRISGIDGHFFMPQGPVKVLPSPELKITPEVQREIKILKSGNFVRHTMPRRNEHIQVVEEIFRDEGLPLELTNLALVESGFKTEAKSPSGALGLWQLMKPTARIYGLRVGGAEDQRKDTVLSSIAAARHLRDLFYLYNDWHLALAAYNAGTGSIDRALLRSRTANYWDLMRSGKLKKETARFVPRFIATCILVKEHEQSVLSAKNSALTEVG